MNEKIKVKKMVKKNQPINYNKQSMSYTLVKGRYQKFKIT